jgi:signal transduction histidine kinase
MIRDILDISKLQSKGMDFTKTNIGAAEVLEPMLDKYATLCDYLGVSLHISESVSHLPPLLTNAACIRQLLGVLLDNSIKFVKEGGGIWLDASVSRKYATICVRDNGIGIEKEALPHIYERFFKCSHDFNESGSGLGLAIAKEIALGLKEKIWAESETGRGTAIFFTVRRGRA